MNYISTTDLRTKALKLRDSLQRGESTYLLHRSKVIGVVEPYEEKEKVASREMLEDISKIFASGKIYSDKKRKEIYLKHLEEKYGKSIS